MLISLLGCAKTEKTNPTSVNPNQEEPALHAEHPLLEPMPGEATGIQFQNSIIETYENNITTNINIYNGGGVARWRYR